MLNITGSGFETSRKINDGKIKIDFFGEIIQISQEGVLKAWGGYLADKGRQSFGKEEDGPLTHNPESRFHQELHDPEVQSLNANQSLCVADQGLFEEFISYKREVQELVDLRDALLRGEIRLNYFLSQINLPLPRILNGNGANQSLPETEDIDAFFMDPNIDSFGRFFVDFVREKYLESFNDFDKAIKHKAMVLETRREFSILGFKPFKGRFEEEQNRLEKIIVKINFHHQQIMRILDSLKSDDKDFNDFSYFGLVIALNAMQEQFNF